MLTKYMLLEKCACCLIVLYSVAMFAAACWGIYKVIF